MNIFKILLALLVLLLAVVGAFFLFGLLAWAVKLLFWLGLIALAVGVAAKLLKKAERPRYQLNEVELELQETDRLIAEYREKQLLK